MDEDMTPETKTTETDFLQSEAGQAALREAVEAATQGLKNKRDELLEANRRLKNELGERQNEGEAARQRLNHAEGQLRHLIVDAGLTEALSRAKVAPEFLEAARALIKSREDISVAEKDGLPVALVGEQPLNNFVSQWAQSDSGRHFLAPAGNSGGGAPGGSGGAGQPANPWRRDQRNLGEQARILREDPTLAQQLKAQAGTR